MFLPPHFAETDAQIEAAVRELEKDYRNVLADPESTTKYLQGQRLAVLKETPP